MKLEDARKHYDYFSGKTSELTRQLAFAGIAIIWIFKTTGTGPVGQTPLLPTQFVLPLWLIVIALSLDFLHYLFGSISWGAYSWWQERKYNSSDASTGIEDSPGWINWPHLVVYWLKIVALLSGYGTLFFAMWKQLI
jgi:hypothetical protein